MLASLPIGGAVNDSEGLRVALSWLDVLLLEVLREIHTEWQDESFDGISVETARKTGSEDVEILGVAILINDQTWTPFWLRLQLDPSADTVAWLDLRLGETGSHGMVRLPYDTADTVGKRLCIDARRDTMTWAYHVGFGERQRGECCDQE